MRRPAAIAAVATVIAAALAATPTPAIATTTVGIAMDRLYNPNSGEHFYTSSSAEWNHLVGLGWRYEGIGWMAPAKSSTPVYRLYNPNAGDHHYTTSAAERDSLVRVGWRYEGVGWYSNDARTVPLYRQYNPNAAAGSHNYTASKSENDSLVRVGWRAEGIGWYGLRQKRWIPEQWREYTYYECRGCGFHTENLEEMDAHLDQALRDMIENNNKSNVHYKPAGTNYWAIPSKEVIPGTGVFEFE